MRGDCLINRMNLRLRNDKRRLFLSMELFPLCKGRYPTLPTFESWAQNFGQGFKASINHLNGTVFNQNQLPRKN